MEQPDSVVTSRVNIKEILTRIADFHITRYQSRLDSSSSIVNHRECEDYLEIWKTTKRALDAGAPILRSGIDEITDALTSGEVDHLMSPEELKEMIEWELNV